MTLRYKVILSKEGKEIEADGELVRPATEQAEAADDPNEPGGPGLEDEGDDNEHDEDDDKIGPI